MPTDVTLGGQQFSVDNPSQILGLLDNLMKLQITQRLQQKQEEEKQSLLQTLERFNLNPVGEVDNSGMVIEDVRGDPEALRRFSDLGRSFRGARSRGEGQEPELLFDRGGGKPQVTNLRQLVDVIQGLKGLPPEFASAIVGRLTGIADPSEAQNEKLLRLRESLRAPQQEEVLRLRGEEQKRREKAGEEQLSQQRELTLKRLRAAALSNIIKSSINPKERQSATEELMKLLTGKDESVGGRKEGPTFSNFRRGK